MKRRSKKPRPAQPAGPPRVRTLRPRLAVIAGAVLVAFNVTIFGPHQIFAPNASEFEATYAEVLPLLAGFGMSLALLLSLTGLAIPSRARPVYAALLLGTGLLLWTQGSFLKWNYGDFNGVNIDWSRYPWQGWVDASLWIVVLGLAVRFRSRLLPHAHVLAALFVVLQTGLMLVGRSSAPSARVAAADLATRGVSEVPAETCGISKRLNVFHIILDSFQTDVFLELVGEEDLSRQLDGFVVYRDNAAPASYTMLCVPAIFTGEHYDGDMLPSEYYRSAVQNSFHHVLGRNGFVTNLVPYVEMPNAGSTTYYSSPRTYAWPRRTQLMQSASFMIDIAMFRQTPHFAKRAVYNSRNWRLSSLVATPPNHFSFHQKAFFRDYIAKLSVTHDAPAYHFVHLSPPHPPYVTTAEGEYAGEALPDTRENFKNEARYVLRIFMDFLARLRDLDAYDRSIIVLQGDHGSTFAPIFDGREFPVPVNRLPALLALKTVDAQGTLRVSEAPTSAADLPATLLDLLQIEHAFPGESIVRMEPQHQRRRTYLMLDESTGGNRVLKRWTIDGSIYDEASFRPFEPQEIETEIHDYAWGTTLGFGFAGTGEAYLAAGWWPAATMHWANAFESRMQLRVPQPHEDVVVELGLFFHIVPGEVDQQRMRLRINGSPVGSEQVSRDPEPKGIRYVVPHGLLESGLMTLDFEFPDAALLTEGRRVPVRRAVGLWSFRADLRSTFRSGLSPSGARPAPEGR